MVTDSRGEYESRYASPASMKKKVTTRLALSLLVLAQATWALPLARAGFDLKDTADNKGSTVV